MATGEYFKIVAMMVTQPVETAALQLARYSITISVLTDHKHTNQTVFIMAKILT